LRLTIAVSVLLSGLRSEVAAQSAQGSFTFVASVLDARTREPVVAAFAAALGTDRFATTDDHGSFRIDGLPGGEHTIRIWRLGYRTAMFRVRFDSVETNILDVPIVLEPIPVQMPEIVVEAERTRLIAGVMRDFYRRRAEGAGLFIDREEIEARRADAFVDLMRGIPSLDVEYLGNLQWTLRLPGKCSPLYYVDGVRSNEGVALSIRPEQLEGVEIYRRLSEVPLELTAGQGMCGVIVLWTRR
jgi:hypothetical protein